MDCGKERKTVKKSKNGRMLLLLVLTLLATAIVLGGYLACKPAQLMDKRPNIVFISIDTLRADHLHCYGYPRKTSPNIDQLAADGARFERAVSPSPWTLPSHISMFTGQEVSVHNVRRSQNSLADHAVTFTELLQQNGYATFGIGSSPYLKKRYGYAQGFDVYDDELGQISYKKSHEAITAKKAVNKALRAIKERKNKRWFVFIHMWDVHYDYLPPAPYDRMFAGDYAGDFDMINWEKNRDFKVGMNPEDFRYVISQYDGEIAWVDSQIGLLVAKLKEWGLYENTVIVITSDHGEEFLDHGQKGHGHSLFDELIRVPIIVTGPGVPAGMTVDCPVGLIDLYPTFTELAEVEDSGYRGPGRSLFDRILQRSPCNPDREFYCETKFSNLDKLFNYKRGFEMMLEVNRFKFHKRVNKPLRELLFNIAEDPQEENDLTEADAERADEMRKRLLRHGRRNEKLRRERRLAKKMKLDKKTYNQLKQLGYIQ